jgi:cephalosporin-C deacetylase-like acetyl esterase
MNADESITKKLSKRGIDTGGGFFLKVFVDRYRADAIAIVYPELSNIDREAQFSRYIQQYSTVSNISLEDSGNFEMAAGLIFCRDGNLIETIKCLQKSPGKTLFYY